MVAQVSGEPDLEEPAEDGEERGCEFIAGRKGKDQMGSKMHFYNAGKYKGPKIVGFSNISQLIMK